MYENTYTGGLIIQHNDPLQDSLLVSLTMNLTGTPNIDIEETYIEFPETVVGSSNSYIMNVHNSGTADLEISGKQKLSEIGLTLKESTNQIPKEIDWIIMVESHTDKLPIKNNQFPSNWELSTARANSVLKLLLELGFAPNRLAAAGYGEFYPISEGEADKDYQQNRRIELKLTSR